MTREKEEKKHPNIDLIRWMFPDGQIPEMPLEEDARISLRQLLKSDYEDFRAAFPEVTLPVTLTDQTIHVFNQYNKPFPQRVEKTFLRTDDDDEYTEYMPCFRIPHPQGFEVLVYWKGGLMDQQYILLTVDKRGRIIARLVIAGIKSDGKYIARLTAHIDEDWIIHMTAGKVLAEDESTYDPTSTYAFEAEILPDGQIQIEDTDNLFQ